MLYLPHIIGVIYLAMSVCLFNLYMGRDCKIPVSISYLRIIGLFLLGLFVFKVAYPFNIFSFVSSLFIILFIINLFFIVLNFYRPVDYIGLILNPVIFLSLLTFVLFDLPQGGSIVEKNLYIHIIFSLSSYGFLFLAGIQALILKYQITSIKNVHHSTLLNSFPSIEEMGKIMHRLILSGFILLTLSLLSGIPYMNSAIGHENSQKIIFSIIAWIAYLYLLFKKSHYGINDTTAANMTIGGLVFLLFAYLGTKLFIG